MAMMVPRSFNLIGPRIAQARREQNLSKEEVCARLERLGIDVVPYVLTLLENQESIIYDYQVPAYAEALNVTVEWLYRDLKNDPPFKRSRYAWNCEE